MVGVLYVAGFVILVSGVSTIAYLFNATSGNAHGFDMAITAVSTFFGSITFFALGMILEKVSKLVTDKKFEDNAPRDKFTERF
jgi:uncharacterized membrane protein HdeD (DUF308 family)